MQPRSLLNLCLLALFSLLLALPGVAGAFCATESPESVLTCLVEAFESRDIDACLDLFSEDFVFQFGSDAETSWGLDEEEQAYRNLFSHPDIIEIRLQLHDYRVTEGEHADTWILEDVAATLTVTQANSKSDEPLELKAEKKNNIFHVRRVTHPEVHYEIFKWIDLSHE
jgi:hypothetical protein